MRGIDLFSGAGGMSLGAKLAGINTAISIDINKNALDTFHRNHPHSLALRADLEKVDDILLPCSSEPTVVFGGPPCQGFSTSNQRTRNASNEKNWLFSAFIRLVKSVRPQWVVFENVKGILETDDGSFAKLVERQLRANGYATSSGLLNAVDFGVPQSRTRFFIIARRGDRVPDLPNRTAERQITVAEAISDLPSLRVGANESELPYAGPPKSRYAKSMRRGLTKVTGNMVSTNADFVVERYKYIPQGGNWRDIPEYLMGNYADRSRCHTGIYRRLRADKPSVVIGNFRKNMLVHPTEDRGLSVREAARLQSFPDNYEFAGSIGLQQQQVGNAVPPLLAKAVFDHILKLNSDC